MSKMVLRVAAKAVIVNDAGKVLIVREASSYGEGTQIGRYMLPGGRLDIGESYENGLRREAREETGLDVEPFYPIYVGEWIADIKGKKHQIIAIFSVCRAKTIRVKLSNEHDSFEWIDPKERHKYDIMETDQKVLDAYVRRATH